MKRRNKKEKKEETKKVYWDHLNFSILLDPPFLFFFLPLSLSPAWHVKMKVEIESAANFLQNLLRLHSSDLIVDRLEVFREALSNALTLHYKEHWFPERPFKGSGYRCLRINHKMDPVITKAGLTCGLGNNKFYSLK